MDRVTVYDVPDEGKKCLGRDVWEFIYFERIGLVLDYYAHEERDSLRKKFKVRSMYNRLTHNRYRGNEVTNISEADVLLPDWVKDQAKEIFFDDIRLRVPRLFNGIAGRRSVNWIALPAPLHEAVLRIDHPSVPSGIGHDLITANGGAFAL